MMVLEVLAVFSVERHSKLQNDYRELAGTFHEQKLLIQQLEEDLRSVNALSTMFRGDAEVQANTHHISAGQMME